MLKRSFPFVLVFVLAASVAAPVAAQPTKFMYATGKLFQGNYIDPGQMIFRPNQVHIRNAVAGWYIVGVAGPAAPFFPSESWDETKRQFPGPARFVINCNLDANYQGECWGTAEFGIGDGGWIAAWSGKFDLYNYVAQVSLTARGTGTFAGKELKLDAMGPAADGDFYFLSEVITK